MASRVHWTDEEVSVLIHILLEQKNVGNWAGTGPNSAGHKNTASALLHNHGISKTPKQIKNKYESLKAEFACWTNLKNNETGLGFDIETGTIQASEEWWKRKIREDPLAKKFRNRPPILEDVQDEIFTNSIASGNSQWTPSSNSFLPGQSANLGVDLNLEFGTDADDPGWDNSVGNNVQDEESTSPPKSNPRRSTNSGSQRSGEKRKRPESSSAPNFDTLKDILRTRSVVVQQDMETNSELDTVFQILNELFVEDLDNPLYEAAVNVFLTDIMKRKGFIRFPPEMRMRWLKKNIKI